MHNTECNLWIVRKQVSERVRTWWGLTEAMLPLTPNFATRTMHIKRRVACSVYCKLGRDWDPGHQMEPQYQLSNT
jgi:hypothetical protein